MKGVINLLPVFFFVLSFGVKAISIDDLPRSKPDFRPHSRAGFDLVELQLQQDQNEWESTHVDWDVSLANGTAIPIIFYPNRSKIWYRVPPAAIIPPHTGENTSDNYMVRLVVRARNPGILGRSFIGRGLNVDQNVIGFSVDCYFTRYTAYAVDPDPNYWPKVPVQAYMSIDEEYPVPVINLKLPLYERLKEIVHHRAMIHVELGHVVIGPSQQNQQASGGEDDPGSNVDEVDFYEQPVVDKSDATAPTREEVQQAREIEQLGQQQQLSQDDDRLPTYIIWIAAGGAPVTLGQVPEVTTDLVDYVQSYSAGFQSGF